MSEEYVTGIDQDYAEYVASFSNRIHELSFRAAMTGDSETCRLLNVLSMDCEGGKISDRSCLLFNKASLKYRPAEETEYNGSKWLWTMLSKPEWLLKFQRDAIKTGAEFNCSYDLDESEYPELVYAAEMLEDWKLTDKLDDAKYKRLKFRAILLRRILEANQGLMELFCEQEDEDEEEEEEDNQGTAEDKTAEKLGFEFMRHPMQQLDKEA